MQLLDYYRDVTITLNGTHWEEKNATRVVQTKIWVLDTTHKILKDIWKRDPMIWACWYKITDIREWNKFLYIDNSLTNKKKIN